MTEPSEPTPEPSESRRFRRADRRRRTFKRVVAVVGGLALLAGVALVATETVRIGGPDRPSLARTVSVGDVKTTTTTTTTKSTHVCRGPITVDDPLRLWVGGDSLAGALGPALGTTVAETGVVQPYFDSRVSSGLNNPTFFDWPRQATQEMARLDPEVAIFMIGANDWGVPPANGTDDAWKADYVRRIEEMYTLLRGDDRLVVWVVSPPFQDKRDAAIKQLRDVAQEVIAKHPDAVFFDTYGQFLDADGKYAQNLPDADGTMVTVRSGDGVHFTPDGGARLADLVYKAIDPICKITGQKVEGVTKPIIQTQGSTQVAPSGGSSSGGSVQTTPPATAPTTTQPPVQQTQPTTTTLAPTTTTTTTQPTTPQG